ncbi:MAG: hypothetical protein ACFCVC_17425 [Acidimicrobiia bacterium]
MTSFICASPHCGADVLRYNDVMRRTFTTNSFVVDTAARLRTEEAIREEVERRLGEKAAGSESAALRQIAEIGARVLVEAAAERGYGELAELLEAEPSLDGVQTEPVGNIEGEEESQFEALFAALNERS